MSGYIGTEPTIAAAGYSDWVPLQTVVASYDSNIGFSGMNSDFDEYKFEIVGIHPGTDNVSLKWQCNSAEETGFNEPITSSAARAYLQEDHSGGAVDDRDGENQHNGTAYELVVDNTGGDADQNMCAILTIYAPSSTTYHKHFVLEGTSQMSSDGQKHDWRAGYINTTNAITEVNFKFSSGVIQTGTITMFGLGK